jgi:Trk K+ transport system NAD-binding subunit
VDYVYKPRPAWQRTIIATWRDTTALWREFRRPVLAFFLVTVVGGYIYGELHAIAGYGHLPVIDRPYIMVQLMVLETPTDYEVTPREWYLIAYWYLLPAVLLFIVGDGVADFVRLFFDREKRGNAWRQAVVSTYRHHVIVLGAGHVGLRVIRILHEMQVDVVVIDNDPDEEVDIYLRDKGIPLIQGDAHTKAILEKAGLIHADAFVACTGNDDTNMHAIMRARSMNKDIRIVGRVWDDQIAEHMQEFMGVEYVLSSSGIAAPAFAGLALGVEITQTMTIRGEKYSTLRVTVNEGSFMDGATVGDLQNENDADIVLYCKNEDDMSKPPDVQPHRDIVVRAGDTLVIFALHERSLDIATRNRFKR